jgi:hypothetical protein
MTTRYQMRLKEVDTIEFNINLTQNDIESVDVMTLDEERVLENDREVKLVENIDYQFSHDNKSIFKNLSNKKILYIKITRKSDKNFIIENLEAKYKNKEGKIISFFNSISGNKLSYYVGFPDRTRR